MRVGCSMKAPLFLGLHNDGAKKTGSLDFTHHAYFPIRWCRFYPRASVAEMRSMNSARQYHPLGEFAI